MKIELFNKMIHDKYLDEESKKLDQLNAKYAQIIDEMENQFTNLRTEYLEKIELRALEQSQKILSKTKAEALHKKIVKKNELLKRLKETLTQSVEKETSTEGYRKYLLEKFNQIYATFDSQNALIIFANSRDAQILQEQLPKMVTQPITQLIPQTVAQPLIQIDHSLIGGFYIVKNEIERYDYTLNSEIEATENLLGCMIRHLFESTEEVCDGII